MFTSKEVEKICTIVLFLMGTSTIMIVGKEAMESIWVSVIIASIIGFILIYMYLKLLSHFPGKNYFEIIKIVLGRKIGNFICFIYIIFLMLNAAAVIENIMWFVSICVLQKTPKSAVLGIIGIAIIGITRKNIDNVNKWSKVVLPILLSIILLATFMAMPIMKPFNMYPLFSSGWENIIKSSVAIFFIPFAELFAFIIFFGDITSINSMKKIYYTGLLIGAIIILAVYLKNLLIIGPIQLKGSYFPSLVTARRINIMGSVERIEIVITSAFLVGSYLKSCVLVVAALKTTKEAFETKDMYIYIVPLVLLCISLALIENDSIMAFMIRQSTWIIPAFIFQLLIPFILLVIVTFMKKRNKLK